MVLKKDEIKKSHSQDRSLASAAKREASDKKHAMTVFSKKALQALQAKDERAFAEALRIVKIFEGSAEWKKAWEIFRSGLF